jgi:FtsP/CotA-like multicopper oxidase with cupredoxin domain
MNSNDPKVTAVTTGASRREFLGRALAVAAGVAVSSPSTAEAQTGCQPAGQELEAYILDSHGTGVLRANILMTNENRTIPSTTGCGNPSMLRCFKVVDDTGKVLYPPQAGIPRPGPVLQAQIGETVEIAFVNNVNEAQMFGSVDFGDPKMVMRGYDPLTRRMIMLPEHPQWGCDTAKRDGANTVPFADNYPDCFHGSNAANLHFHGTHVTPNGFGDNVLVQVEPDPSVSVAKAVASFQEIFTKARAGAYSYGKVDWKTAIPSAWQDIQNDRLANYDATHQFQGKMLKDWGLSLKKMDDDAIAANEWPPYQMGAFPNAFVITKRDAADPQAPVMGQAPGTHWYHAHKHGSTTMHLLHGLAGVFVIKGQYDKELQGFYNNGLSEKVMLLQEYGLYPNLYSGGPSRSLLVNGQLTPKVTMAAGEVQLWRIVNGAMQAPMTVAFPTASVTVMQTAQDGVQFRAANYGAQPLGKTVNGAVQFTLSPGNRLDLLVQAKAAGAMTYNGGPAARGGGNFVTVAISGSKTMALPTQQNYPVTNVGFLDDIQPDSVRYSRRVLFNWEAGRTGTGATPNPPQFMINGKQFEEGTVDESMTLGTNEEWTIENGTSIVHPFHIHVNPFQIFEVFDPNTKDSQNNPIIGADSIPLFQNPTPQNKAQRDALIAKCTVKLTENLIWWDTFGIPAGLIAGGKLVLRTTTAGQPGVSALPGYFKMRSRFVDFTGKFVLHCHILGHEDRGMMQLVEVNDRATTVKHH